MAQFRFQVTDPHGQIGSGRLAAIDKNDAKERLQQSGYTVVDPQEIAADSCTRWGAARMATYLLGPIPMNFQNPGQKG